MYRTLIPLLVSLGLLIAGAAGATNDLNLASAFHKARRPQHGVFRRVAAKLGRLFARTRQACIPHGVWLGRGSVDLFVEKTRRPCGKLDLKFFAGSPHHLLGSASIDTSESNGLDKVGRVIDAKNQYGRIIEGCIAMPLYEHQGERWELTLLGSMGLRYLGGPPQVVKGGH